MFLLSMAPHSPLISLLARLQLTTKSLLLSVQVRVVLMVLRISGFRSRSVLVAEKASMYFPRLNLTAVLPFPNRSYAAPMRALTSSHFTPCVERDGYRICVGAEA